jgi:hypothetical protein
MRCRLALGPYSGLAATTKPVVATPRRRHERETYLALLVAFALVGCGRGKTDATAPSATAAAPAASASVVGTARRGPSTDAEFGASSRRALRYERWTAPTGYVLRVRVAIYDTFDLAMADQTPDSVDAMITTLPDTGLDTALVEVRIEARHASVLPKSFETTFGWTKGEEVKKTWSAASSNTSGTYRALITLPRGVQTTRTRPVGMADAGSSRARESDPEP